MKNLLFLAAIFISLTHTTHLVSFEAGFVTRKVVGGLTVNTPVTLEEAVAFMGLNPEGWQRARSGFVETLSVTAPSDEASDHFWELLHERLWEDRKASNAGQAEE